MSCKADISRKLHRWLIIGLNFFLETYVSCRCESGWTWRLVYVTNGTVFWFYVTSFIDRSRTFVNKRCWYWFGCWSFHWSRHSGPYRLNSWQRCSMVGLWSSDWKDGAEGHKDSHLECGCGDERFGSGTSSFALWLFSYVLYICCKYYIYIFSSAFLIR